MTLQIGTILIAKEDFGEFTKGKEYPIVESNNDITYRVICNDEKSVNWFDERRINQHFTIKRYTLTDLKERKIAVKLRNYEEYKRLCEAVGDEKTDEFYFIGDEAYYGVNKPDCFIQLNEYELKGRTLVPSIDLIDLEVKEEKPYIIVESEDTIKHIQQLESEIARLKGEEEKLKQFLKSTYQYLNLDDQKEAIKLLQLRESPQISQDLEKRERMAWELVVKNSNVSMRGITLHESAFKDALDHVKDFENFLAKSKEVGNGK